MTERRSYIGEYEHMSPQERNVALKSLFEAVPSFQAWQAEGEEIHLSESPERVREIHRLYQNRENSQYRQNLLDRYDDLTSYAAVTKSCVKYIRNELDHYACDGIEKDKQSDADSEMSFYGRLLKWNNPLSGGIFSESEAQELEAEIYRHEIKFQLGLKSLGGDAEGVKGDLDDDTLQKMPKFYRDFIRKLHDEEELVRDWRNDYIEKYNVEP